MSPIKYNKPRTVLQLAIFSLGAFSLLVAGDTLILENGQRREADRFDFTDETFTTDPQDPGIPRDTVRDWWLNSRDTDNTAQSASGPPAPNAIAQLKEYRRQAQIFAEEYPNVNGIHLLDNGEFVLTADKRHLYRYHFVGYVMDEAQLDWRDIGLWFTKGRSRCRILRARSLSPEDEVYNLDVNDIKISTPSRGAEHFDPNSRTMSAVIPGVEVGSVIEYIYEYENYAPAEWRLFFPSYYFQGKTPVWKSRFKVRVPVGEKLYSWEQNWRIPGQRKWYSFITDILFFWTRPYDRTTVTDSEGNEYHEYVWSRRKMPPLTPEPRMPPANEITPAVYSTIMKDWDRLNELNSEMQLERLKPTDKIRELAARLTEKCTDKDAKIARLYHWVQKNIRYISVKASLSSGWAGHPAAETLAQGYGDCIDKSVLFATMLQTIDIDAVPVVLRTNDAGLFNPRYPVLACNHAITEVKTDGRIFYLDPTSQDYRYPAFRADDHGALAFNFIDGTRRQIPIPSAMQANGKTSQVEINIESNGDIRVQIQNSYAGAYEAGLRASWKRVPKKARHQIMQQYLNGIAPGARLETFELATPEDLSQPFTMSFAFRAPRYLSHADEYRIFEFPDRALSFPETALGGREHPIAYTTARALHRTINLTFPENMQLLEAPEDFAVETDNVSYKETFTRPAPRTLVLESYFERRAQRIPASQYKRYRDTTLQIQEQTTQPVYFQKTSN